MSYFLDTNICIYFLKGNYPQLIEAFRRKRPTDIKIPAIVKAELLFGVEKNERKKDNRILYDRFLEPYDVVGFDDEAASCYAGIRYNLEKAGTVIGPNDLIIASVVMAHSGILITHNTKEFKTVKGLTIEDLTMKSPH